MRRKDKKGLWITDRFLFEVKGHARLERLARDSSIGFHAEVNGTANAMFSFRDVPVPSRPGYVTHERDYFYINHPDPIIKNTLEEYLFGRFHHQELFNHGHDFAGFLEMAANTALVLGQTFYRIEWGNEKVGDFTLNLPTGFMYLPGETIRRTRHGYTQKYSLVTYLSDKSFIDYFESDNSKFPRTYHFSLDEILRFEYFGHISPVAKCSKYVPTFSKFWQFGLNQSRGGAEPENRKLSVEKTRYSSFSKEKRKYDLSKAMVASIFKYVPTGTGNDFTLTEYYDIFTASRHLKHLCRLRSNMVSDFNQQVMDRIREKNKLEICPKVEMRYLLTEERIDEIVSLYTSEQIDNQQCIKLLFEKQWSK